ncbi:hypothetical protein AB1I63_06550 [Streptococcus pneumoniae]
MRKLGMLWLLALFILVGCSTQTTEPLKVPEEEKEIVRVFKGAIKGLEEEAKVTSKGDQVLVLDLVAERPLSDQEKDYVTRLEPDEVISLIEAGLGVPGEFDRLQSLKGFHLSSQLRENQVFRLMLHFDMKELDIEEARKSALLQRFDLDQLVNATADDLVESLKAEGLVEVK